MSTPTSPVYAAYIANGGGMTHNDYVGWVHDMRARYARELGSAATPAGFAAWVTSTVDQWHLIGGEV